MTGGVVEQVKGTGRSLGQLIKCCLVVWGVLILPSTVSASKMTDFIKKTEIEGEVAVGVHYSQKPKPEELGGKPYDEEFSRVGDLELDFKIKPTKQLVVGFEFRYEIDQSGVDVPKLYGGFSLPNGNQLLAGYLKKKLHTESVIRSCDRAFAKKSLKSRYLKSFNVLGYDLMVTHKKSHVTENNQKIKTRISLGGDPSMHFFANASGQIIGNRLSFNSGIIYVHGKNALEKQNYLVFSSGMRSEFSDKFQFLFEVTTGLDPDATVIAKELQLKDEVYFAAQRSEFRLGVAPTGRALTKIEPVFDETVIFHDLGTWKTSLEIRPGINFYFGKKQRFRWLFNLKYEFVTVAPDFKEFSRLEQGAHTEVQICW